MDYNITWRKKDKGWQAIISYKDNFDKWKQKSKQGFKTQKDGKPWLDKTLKDLESNIKNNINLNDSDKTFKDVGQIFLDHMILYKEYYTVKGYKNCLSKFNTLDNKKIQKTEKYDIQSVFDGFIKEGLKQSTIETYLRRINTFFKYVKDDLKLITELPTVDIKIPKEKNPSNKKAITKKELDLLLKNLKGNKFYIVAFIAAKTGLRLGEVLGLTWNDLDEINLTLNINKQWKVSKETKKSDFGALKSKNSYRIVPISNKTLKELKSYKKNNPTDIYNRIAPFNATSIDKYLNPKLREFAGISMHELRHTYATLLISAGVDFKTAAELLGHTVEMTMKLYSHVTIDMLKRASETISKIF